MFVPDNTSHILDGICLFKVTDMLDTSLEGS